MNQPDFRRVFMDTGAYFALASPRDSHHDEALRIHDRILHYRSHIFTTNFVLAETHALILARVGRDPAAQFLADLDASPTTTLIRITEGDEQRARDLIWHYQDKRFSYTDAASFAIMERLQLTTAFAFDRNFIQYGFTVLQAT
jgi:uncharacterized protein